MNLIALLAVAAIAHVSPTPTPGDDDPPTGPPPPITLPVPIPDPQPPADPPDDPPPPVSTPAPVDTPVPTPTPTEVPSATPEPVPSPTPAVSPDPTVEPPAATATTEPEATPAPTDTPQPAPPVATGTPAPVATPVAAEGSARRRSPLHRHRRRHGASAPRHGQVERGRPSGHLRSDEYPDGRRSVPVSVDRDSGSGNRPGNNTKLYRVQPGDCLSAIAERYGLDWHDLAVWNRLRDPNLIYPGQLLSLTIVQ